MTNGDYEGRSCLYHPHTNNGFFFLLTTKYLIKRKRIPESPEYAKIRHGHIILTLQRRHGSTCGQRAAVRFYLSLGLVWYVKFLTWVKTTEIPIWCARNLRICVTSTNINCTSYRDFDVNGKLFIFKNVDSRHRQVDYFSRL